MFCKHCGSQLRDDSTFCHNCGAVANDRQPQRYASSQPQQYQPPYPQNGYARSSGNNTLAIVGFVLAFFFPLAGLICSILGYNKAKQGAPHSGLALAGVIISAVFVALSILLLVISLMYATAFYKLIYYFFAFIFNAH